jgi:hypothetical protein
MNNLTFLLALISILLFSTPIFAQKTPVYAELGLGWGQTTIPDETMELLADALGSTFEGGIGNNLHTAFYIAPNAWKGLGIGSRIKGTFGGSQKGANGDDYIFNYYNLSVSAKYFPLSKQFNKGLYARGGFGFGQFTSKRVNEAAKLYLHQYAIGTTATLSLGYAWKLKRNSIGFEAEYETSSRNGTINGIGEATFRSGQLGGNIYLTF